MSEWISILGLIFTGVLLVVAEIVFIPGVFIAGTIGLLCGAYGVYLGYESFGNVTGNLVLLSSVLAYVAGIVFTFRSRSWDRFSLKQTMTGKAKEDLESELEVGEKGVTFSALKPVGKAIFHDKEYEVRTKGGYLEENVPVEIEKIERTRIFVKPIS